MPSLQKQSSHQSCPVKKGNLRNFAKFTGKHLCQRLFFNKIIKKESLAQMFSCGFCKISKNTFFTEHLRTNASIITDQRCASFIYCATLVRAFSFYEDFYWGFLLLLLFFLNVCYLTTNWDYSYWDFSLKLLHIRSHNLLLFKIYMKTNPFYTFMLSQLVICFWKSLSLI